MVRIARLAGSSLAALAAAVPLAAPQLARADGSDCRVLELDFIPAARLDQGGPTPGEPGQTPMRAPPQIVAWLEDEAGTYIETVYMTEQTGRFGLGNRPGRFDFNSGPMWPYGRRITVFPVWAQRHPFEFPEIVFRNESDSALSHPFDQSSPELHFCTPMLPSDARWMQADAGTCASTVHTDKGKVGAGVSRYPPRIDVIRHAQKDDPSVDEYLGMNPFDAISAATPVLGEPALASWTIPPALPSGNYVLWVEASREFDHNATYSPARFPAPSVGYGEYGAPYRGQPSTLYRIPIAIDWIATSGSTSAYAGYGDPMGADGAIRPPDATISTAVIGSGAQRFAMTPGGYLLRAIARPEPDFAPPAATGELALADVTSRSARLEFTAPGDDGMAGRVRSYDVRIRVGSEFTEDNFAESTPVTARVRPGDPGSLQTLEVTGLLFETEYTVGIRALDDCRNAGPITVLRFTTAPREVGEVDACFIATAAYGSAMAADVERLRGFRDGVLQRTMLGELAVEAYYTFGPAIASLVAESDLLRETARGFLDPVVAAIARR